MICWSLLLVALFASSTEPGLYGDPGSDESLDAVLESVQLTATPLKREEGERNALNSVTYGTPGKSFEKR